MDPVVFCAVLAAAGMHAGWNAVVKLGLDRFSSVLLVSIVQSGLALLLIPALPIPAIQSWPWLVASALLHSGYKIFLIRAYEHGDLSQVYPLARGTAPVVVAILGALLLGETTTPAKMLAVVSIGLGVVAMSLKGGEGLSSLSPKALAYAMGTAAFTAAYTIIDGLGARLSGNASAFTMWMFVGDGIGMMIFALAARGWSAFLALTAEWRSGLLAGAMSLGSYWIAIWAFTLAPIALVAALRETSVLFAMLIGATVLKENVRFWRWAAGGLILFGVILIRV